MVGAPVTFWCEFSSPYGYVGAEQIGGIAAQAGRPLVWRPFLLWSLTGGRHWRRVATRRDKVRCWKVTRRLHGRLRGDPLGR